MKCERRKHGIGSNRLQIGAKRDRDNDTQRVEYADVSEIAVAHMEGLRVMVCQITLN